MIPRNRVWMIVVSALFVSACDDPAEPDAAASAARPPQPGDPATAVPPIDSDPGSPASAAADDEEARNREISERLRENAREQGSMRADQTSVIDLGKMRPLPGPDAPVPPAPSPAISPPAPPDPDEMEELE